MPINSSQVVLGLIFGLVLVIASLIAERFGMPAETIRMLMLGVFGVFFAGGSLLSRASSLGAYFVGERRILPWAVAGALTIVAFALIPGLADLVPSGRPTIFFVLCLALLLYGIFAAPVLARDNGLTFFDMIQTRFGSRTLAGAMAAIAALIFLLITMRFYNFAVSSVAKSTGLPLTVVIYGTITLAFLAGIWGGISSLVACTVLVVSLALTLGGTSLAVGVLKSESAWPVQSIIQILDGPALHLQEVQLDLAFLTMTLTVTGFFTFLNIDATSAGEARIRRAPVLAVLLFFAIAGFGVFPWLANAGETQNRTGMPMTLATLHAAIIPALAIAGFGIMAHASATALAQDLFFRLAAPRVTSSARLALQRLIYLGVFAMSAWSDLSITSEVRTFEPAAYFLVCAIPLPVILLSRYTRADWKAAFCAFAGAGMAGAAVYFQYIPMVIAPVTGFVAALSAGFISARLLGPAT